MVALKATPVYALAPIFLLWFGNGMSSKILLAALVCFFPVLVNSIKGLSAVDEDAILLLKSFKATKTQIFFKVRVNNRARAL